MTEYFKVLSEDEFEKLKDAIAIITIYIAGADGDIEEEETEWAEKVTKIRSYNLPDALASFYEEVGEDFHDRLESYKTQLNTVALRNAYATEKLTALNPILAKLNTRLGASLYDSYISFAKHVAKASGGFLGFFSIGPKEAAVLDLEMITPVIWEEDEEGTLDDQA